MRHAKKNQREKKRKSKENRIVGSSVRGQEDTVGRGLPGGGGDEICRRDGIALVDQLEQR